MKSGKLQAVATALAVWAILAGGADFARAASEYPNKQITFHIPYSAGGATDLACRALGDGVAKALGQPLIPVNRGGAGGTLAAMAVMSSKPDGYTLGGNSTSNLAVAPFADDNPYKDLKGFTQIMNFGNYIWTVMVRDDAPWKNWKEFIEWARKNPGAAKIGISGSKTNTIRGLCFWLIEEREKVKFTYIPLKGTADLMTTLLGGHTNVSGSAADTLTVPYLKTGKIRILLYMCDTKLPGTENVPTLEELYGFKVPNIMGVFGPKGMPEPVLKRLDDAFAKGVKEPNFVKVMNQMYMPIVYMNRPETTKYVDSVFQKTGEVIKMLKASEGTEKK